MQYLGGKSRIAKEISKIFNDNKRESFVSLFCGTCSVESLVDFPKITLNDAHPYLIACLQDFQKGRDFPDVITEEDYKRIKHEFYQ